MDALTAVFTRVGLAGVRTFLGVCEFDVLEFKFLIGVEDELMLPPPLQKQIYIYYMI